MSFLQAEGNVNLKHILSFWRFLSIEKARKLSIIGQVGDNGYDLQPRT